MTEVRMRINVVNAITYQKKEKSYQWEIWLFKESNTHNILYSYLETNDN